MSNINTTQKKGNVKFNLAVRWKRKYKNKADKEPWYLLTNIENLDDALKIYQSWMGIEAMLSDRKTGGYIVILI